MQHLTIIAGPAGGRTFPLSGDRVPIGREFDNAVCIDHASLSRYHAELVAAMDGYVVRDLQSMLFHQNSPPP